MNIEDREMIEAERDASPERFAGSRTPQPDGEQRAKQRPGEDVEENASHRGSVVSSSTSSTSSSDTTTRRPDPLLRGTTTQVEREVLEYLERHPTAIHRIEAHRLQHSQTVGTSKIVSAKDLPIFGGGKPYPPPLPEREEYVTEFNGHDDPGHPQNWSLRTKVGISAILVLDSFAATLASSVFSPAATAIGQEFAVGQEVTTLGTSLFVLGYAFGPIIWAPISELYGRRLPTILAALMFGIFEIAIAVAKDLQTVMVSIVRRGLDRTVLMSGEIDR